MNRTAFEQVALEWHHEKYVVLTRAQPARADEVAAWLRNHLFPFMTAHGCTSGEQVTRQVFIGFQDWVADPSRVDLGPAPADPGEMLTVAQAVERSGVSTSSVKRRLRDGGFPNAVQEERRWLIPAGDLHAAGLLGGPLRRGPRSLPKNHQQQSEMRKVLADILAFGQDMGRWTLQFDPAAVPLKLRQTPQAQRRQLSLKEAAEVAGRLHVVQPLRFRCKDQQVRTPSIDQDRLATQNRSFKVGPIQLPLTDWRPKDRLGEGIVEDSAWAGDVEWRWVGVAII